ncbi:glycosyl transferase family 2 [Rivularia sp. IAM M-261]|nr:glycosyl transferase family 2 [Calothrix sp. PCC 7716]GJD23578.1 glycosyl transferase family 2 [Rivularia sp. IAM M-261]
MITFLEIFCLIICFGSVCFYLACAIYTLLFFTNKDCKSENNIEPVSILVSVKGIDEKSWDNWFSLCNQNYPDYEVLFGVTDKDDPAIVILEKLVKIFPDRVKYYSDLVPLGVNLKDSNLSYLLEKSQHEILIFADGDIKVSPEYIRFLTAPLKNHQVGAVTCAYILRSPNSLIAALASFGRCFDFLPSVLIARAIDFGLRFAIGVTIATSKSTLLESGSLHTSRIGSDYNLGKRIALAGYQIYLSPYVLDWNPGSEGIGQLYARELRWARTIRYNRGSIYYGMIFCYGTVFCLPLLILSGFTSWAVAICLTVILVRYAQVLVSIFCMKSPKLLLWLWALPLRDLLSLVIWVIGCFGKRIYWSGRFLSVEGDGLISPWE